MVELGPYKAVTAVRFCQEAPNLKNYKYVHPHPI